MKGRVYRVVNSAGWCAYYFDGHNAALIARRTRADARAVLRLLREQDRRKP